MEELFNYYMEELFDNINIRPYLYSLDQYSGDGVKYEINKNTKLQTVINDSTGVCLYYPKLIINAEIAFRELLLSCNFHPDVVNINNQTFITTRHVFYFREEEFNNNITMLKLKTKIEELVGEKFDYAVLNLYKDGQDVIGWHNDKNNKGSSTKLIVSLSLGATRDFMIKPYSNLGKEMWNKNGRDGRYTISLSNGDILIMASNMQYHYKHSIPKRVNVLCHNIPNVLDEFECSRINITFRQLDIKN